MSDDLSKGRAFGYVRASTAEQKATLEIQQNAILAEYNYRYAKEYRWGGHYVDSGVSGSKPLTNRPAGSQLMIEATAGDVVIFHKLDRGFRSMIDLLGVIDQWQLKGVRMVLMDVNCDTSTAVGMMLVKMLGVFSEFERARVRERCEDMARSRRKQGRPSAGRRAPLGFVHSGPRGDLHYVCDPAQREIMGWMLGKFEAGWTVQQIRWQLNADGKTNYEGQSWKDRAVEAHVAVEQILRAYEKARGIDLRGATATAEVIDMVRSRQKLDKR